MHNQGVSAKQTEDLWDTVSTLAACRPVLYEGMKVWMEEDKSPLCHCLSLTHHNYTAWASR